MSSGDAPRRGPPPRRPSGFRSRATRRSASLRTGGSARQTAARWLAGRFPRACHPGGNAEVLHRHALRIEKAKDVVIGFDDERGRLGEGRVLCQNAGLHVPVRSHNGQVPGFVVQLAGNPADGRGDQSIDPRAARGGDRPWVRACWCGRTFFNNLSLVHSGWAASRPGKGRSDRANRSQLRMRTVKARRGLSTVSVRTSAPLKPASLRAGINVVKRRSYGRGSLPSGGNELPSCESRTRPR